MKKIWISLIVLILIIGIFQFGSYNNYFINSDAESGAPPINGTTDKTWYIETNEDIIRKNEVIITSNIQINYSAKMDWYNMNSKVNGDMKIDQKGIFNITNSTIQLTGNLFVYGVITLRNTTIIMNCTQNGTFHIEVGIGGEMYIYDYDNNPNTNHDRSNITSIFSDKRHRYWFWVKSGSKFSMKNSELHECGYYSKNDFNKGLYVQTNNVLFENCIFSENQYGIFLSQSNSNKIINCSILNSLYGIIFNESNNNEVINCEISGNVYGIYGWFGCGNNFFNNYLSENGYCIWLVQSQNNNFEKCNIYKNNHGIVFRFSSDINTIENCEIINNDWGGIWTTCSEGVIKNCNILNNYWYGIDLDGENNKILNCNISGNIKGIWLGSDESGIFNNNITNNDYGIYCGHSKNSIVQNNIIVGNLKYAIYTYGSSSTLNSQYNYFGTNDPNILKKIIYGEGIDYSNWFTWTPSKIEYINSTQIWKDTTKILDNGLIINGDLTLDNVDLIFNNNLSQNFIQVNNNLKITNSKIYSGYSNYSITYIDSIVNIDNTSFIDQRGISLNYCDYSFLDNLSFKYGFYGILVRSTVKAKIENCNFISTYRSGIIIGQDYVGVIKEPCSGDIFISNCYFFSNYLYGIYLEDEVFGNNIMNCEFEKNYISIYLYSYYAFFEDEKNIIYNCNFYENHRSIYYYYSGYGHDVSNCNFYSDNISFLLENSDRIKIDSCKIQNSKYKAIYGDSCDDVKIINSSIEQSSGLDIDIDSSSDLFLINTIFNEDKISIKKGSCIYIEWFLNVRVVDKNYKPISNAIIRLQDNENETFDENYTTNFDGRVQWIVCTEYKEDNISRTNLTPHLLTFYKESIGKGFKNIYINENKDIALILSGNPDLIPKKISISNLTPLQNQLIYLNITILNNGTMNINDTGFTTTIYIDDNLVNEIKLFSLNEKEEQNIFLQWRVNVTPGSHIIKVNVDPHDNILELDEDNNILTKEIIINSKPIAVLNVNQTSLLTNDFVLFDAKESIDDVIEIVSYLFDFGDGNISNWIPNFRIDYIYIDDGEYFARLKARDATGLVSDWSKQVKITVKNRIPKAKFTWDPGTGTVNTIFEFSSKYSSDDDGKIASYFWEFGDGEVSRYQSPSHIFQDDRNYTINLTVQDNDGEKSVIFSKTINIYNLPPKAKFWVSKTAININEVVRFNASLTTDPDDNNITELNYTWNFDDGEIGYGRITTHDFITQGYFNITLTVTDDDFAKDQFVIIIKVDELKINRPDSSNKKENEILFWSIIAILVILILIVSLLLIFKPEKMRKILKIWKKNENSLK